MKKSKMWGAKGFMKRRLRRYVASEQRRLAAGSAPAPVERPSRARATATYRAARRNLWRAHCRLNHGRLDWPRFNAFISKKLSV